MSVGAFLSLTAVAMFLTVILVLYSVDKNKWH